MTLQLIKKQRRKLTREDIAKIIEQDISELLCPLLRYDKHKGGICASDGAHCFNPRGYESCPWFGGRWDGL